MTIMAIMDEWMVRTAENWIAGPYPAEQVREMILSGKISLQDEVCSANGYWFYVHERDEIQRHLGIEGPCAPTQSDEEITETEGVTQSEMEKEKLSADLGSLAERVKPILPQAQVAEQEKAPPRPKFWRGFAWVLVVSSILMISAVFRLWKSE